MAIIQNILLTSAMNNGDYLTPGDRWDGYVAPTNIAIISGTFQGYCLNWNGFDSQLTLNPFQNQQYSGYTTNWGFTNTDGTLNGFQNQNYSGYSTNWGQFDGAPFNASAETIDVNSIIDYPKNQTIYYKLKGFNPNTQQYESWIISHNVTGRPSLDGGLFDPDPGREPPNVERDVFKTPPSGNNLVNIVIVSRWIE